MNTLENTIITRQVNGIGPQHPTQVIAAVLNFVSGRAWKSKCVWCAEMDLGEVFRVRSNFGECDTCPYVGRDCLVVSPA